LFEHGCLQSTPTNSSNILLWPKKNDNLGDITFGYEMKFDFNELGGLSSFHIKAEPEEQEAVHSAIRAALGADRGEGSRN